MLRAPSLYPPAQQYYHCCAGATSYWPPSMRRSRSATRAPSNSDLPSLQTDVGIEDRAHEQFGWVKKGEETAGNVRGLDLDEDEASTFRANITLGSVEGAGDVVLAPFLEACSASSRQTEGRGRHKAPYAEPESTESLVSRRKPIRGHRHRHRDVPHARGRRGRGGWAP